MMSRKSARSMMKQAFGIAVHAAVLGAARVIGRRHQCHSVKSGYARERISSLREKLQNGETAYLIGIGSAGHNTGVGLIGVSTRDGIQLIANHEEERFVGQKHCQEYPSRSVLELIDQMQDLGIDPSQVHAVCGSWDYGAWIAKAAQSIAAELPGSRWLLRPGASPQMNLKCAIQARRTPRKLGQVLHGGNRPQPVINLRHHDNHAWFSWAVSPFAKSSQSTMVLVVDGAGDDGSMSSYIVNDRTMSLFDKNDNFFDSLGMMYGVLSSTQGGWPLLSSEGRYMGAAAWGNRDRLTNPYYMRLRSVFAYESQGRVLLNREMANWHRGGCLKPYSPLLTEILGPPLRPDQMWNPDAVLSVENIEHAPITQDRVDKAAAVQLVFEDALFHMVQHLIRASRSTQLVLTGGTALNCVANMLLLEHFNSTWYERNLGMKDATLHLWIPPVPGDMGVAVGAACHFAFLAGARPGEPLKHAFYCGRAPRADSVRQALQARPEVSCERLGNTNDPVGLAQIADLMAWIVSQDGIIGLYQGAAETGPRALGHRSILANPANPKTRETLNRLVKFRELIRPLAPMATLRDAQRLFVLEQGASDDNYNAYNYMVLTARARKEAFDRVPAVIHKDGTCRVQIVRQETNTLVHEYLIALGRRIGVEVSVNTSLNVGAPIAQTPLQALDTLQRSHGLHGLFMIDADGDAVVAWHNVNAPPKDAGKTLRGWLREWRSHEWMTTNHHRMPIATVGA